MKIFLAALFVLVSTASMAQTAEEKAHWAHWDKNYPLVNAVRILNLEKHYADSIEKKPEITPYYVRKGAYRFKVTFTGNTRLIDSSVVNSIQRVAKLTLPNVNVVDNLLFKEGLFKVGEHTLWMPIQKSITDDFINEVKPGGQVTVYCLFLNEHTSQKKLYNTFIISEFVAL